jgi:hypothetical protein
LIPNLNKGGGSVSLYKPTTILVISMETKSHRKSLGCNPISNALYQNLGMMLNRQGMDRHPLDGMPYLDLDTMLNEQGLSRHILSDVLHHRLNVVKNEQWSSHLTQLL